MKENKMKQILASLCWVLLSTADLCAQMTIEEINHRLDTRPYFELGLEYDSISTIPDSVKIKILNALQRVLPQQYADRVFTLPEEGLKNLKESVWKECGDDTICFEKKYAERYNMNIQSSKKYYDSQCYSLSLVLACGAWNITEAIPYLKKELQNPKCESRARHLKIGMALAKLDDSVKQILMDRYTLSYLIENTPLDTVDNDAVLPKFTDKEWPVTEGMETAMYLKSKEMLVNTLDYIYIKGISGFCIGRDCYKLPEVSFVVEKFGYFPYFKNLPNYDVLLKICEDYKFAILYLYDEKRNRKQQRELDNLLSTEYRTKIRNQIRDWIIENVNFE